MLPRQKIIAIATILMLLLGNIAGTLHIGCDVGSVTPHLANGKQSTVFSCQCAHNTCTSQAWSSQQDNEEPVNAPEHDSDTCSICQGWVSQRFALMALPMVSVVIVPFGSDTVLLDSIDRSVSPHLAKPSLRGPPRV